MSWVELIVEHVYWLGDFKGIDSDVYAIVCEKVRAWDMFDCYF